MLQKSVLIVDEDEGRRRALAHGFAARGERALDVADGFAAMAALGRADFGVVVAAEGRRRLSMRGLCQLARKRHPEIVIFVLPRPGSTPEQIRETLEIPFELLDPGENPERLVTTVVQRMTATEERTAPGVAIDLSSVERDPFNPFADMPSTEDVANVFDSIPRVEIPRISVTEPPTVKPAPLPPIEGPPPTPTPPLPAPPHTPLPVAVGSPVEEEKPEPTAVDALRPASSTQSAPPTSAIVVVDGNFEDIEGGAGAALLMSLFAQELTGRLTADGEANGTLYLHRGEPVWADDPAGDAGIYRKLVQKGFLKPEQAVEPVPEGMLLGSLMQAGLLDGNRMHDFMREIVRDRVIAIATQQSGSYRFTEDRSFLDTAPLLKVNPFGLILDSRRRSVPPPALMALQSEIEHQFLIPGPGLGAASEKIQPFLRGARAIDLINGHRTVRDVLSAAGVDPFMGTLIVIVLRDARLVSLEAQARAQGVDLSAGSFSEASLEFGVVDAESRPEAPSSHEEAQAREDIYALYMRLKPLTQPRQVLGVAVDADEAAIDAAFQARMRELDPRRIPEGSAQHILGQRIEELRRKVQSAYQTLKLQVTESAPARGNPF